MLRLAQLVGPTGEVTGVDSDAAMAAEANRKAQAKGQAAELAACVRHEHGDALALLFSSDGFDAARSERESPWEVFRRTLPLAPQVLFAARVLVALVFALVVVGVMVAVALLVTPAGLTLGAWLRWGLALLLGSVPLALLGITLGYWARPRAAAPLANLLYVALAYAGSLWTSPQSLPAVVGRISPYLPTLCYAEVAWTAVLGRPWWLEDWLWLLGYAVAFGSLAVWGYRRDEGQCYY
jgi:ABC-2 type transport system permease protein